MSLSIGDLEDEIQEFKIDKEALEFGETIGKGGFGFVSKGTYEGEVCAIKQLFIPENARTPRSRIGLSSIASEDDELWRETLNEIAVMLRVQHANILNLYGWSTDPNCVYLVMEFMPFSLHKILETTLPEYDYEPLMKSQKQNLSQLAPMEDESAGESFLSKQSKFESKQKTTSTTLQKKPVLQGSALVDDQEEADRYQKFLQRQPILSNEMKLQIAIDIAEGMHHLHSRPKPIIHRDLKSHNVLLDKNLTSKISDFGFSTMRNRNSGVSGMKGTSGWMAPEMFSSAASSGEKADVYSFGMVMYELVTHLIPFHDVSNPFAVASHVISGMRPKIDKQDELAKSSPILECFIKLVSICCLQDPDERPTFADILNELRSIPLNNSLKLTVDVNGSEDYDSIQKAINAIPPDITTLKPKRPIPSSQSSITKTLSAASMSGFTLGHSSLKKTTSFLHNSNVTNKNLDLEDSTTSVSSPSSDDDGRNTSGGVILGTNNPVHSGDFSEQRLLMQKFNLPFTTRPSDGRKIIKPTRPLTTPVIKIKPGIYREQVIIDRSVVLKGMSEGKSHVILYKPKDVNEVIIFDNVRYSKIRNIIVYNSEYKPQQPGAHTRVPSKHPLGVVVLRGSKCDSTIEQCTFKGVTLEICDKADPTITGNTIRDSPQAGIHIHSDSHGTITENDIFGNLEANILIERGGNPVIENNQIHDGHQEGIRIVEGGLGNIVNNNIYSNMGSNVYIGTGADPLIVLNKILSSEQRGIEIAALAKGKCRKNRLSGNKKDPQILVSETAKTILKDNEIKTNTQNSSTSPVSMKASPTKSPTLSGSPSYTSSPIRMATIQQPPSHTVHVQQQKQQTQGQRLSSSLPVSSSLSSASIASRSTGVSSTLNVQSSKSNMQQQQSPTIQSNPSTMTTATTGNYLNKSTLSTKSLTSSSQTSPPQVTALNLSSFNSSSGNSISNNSSNAPPQRTSPLSVQSSVNNRNTTLLKSNLNK
ncbi:hypothetical protein C9374_013088 [Naegleria lovaniensis]|uniref:Protein kinase domain-containing protein n=1 Tax=Naegleria lovaniensis TaxID=51637 RepID=A0AA88GA26_NAELO|nr:uncharacterized protein C9374_013088 [Naegleria lovaniensis]KAG2372881.1 hypothetical protein C9374_013088 [Naegleria lovaniensis]